MFEDKDFPLDALVEFLAKYFKKFIQLLQDAFDLGEAIPAVTVEE